MSNRENLILKVKVYIDKYRVCTLANLKNDFPSISKTDLVGITSLLRKRRMVKYLVKNKATKEPNEIYYYSCETNLNNKDTVFGNTSTAIKNGLSVLSSFKRHYQVIYDSLAYYPNVIIFVIEKDNEKRLIHLMYLQYQDSAEQIAFIGSLFDSNYDRVNNPLRYVIVERRAMLQGNYPQMIVDNIPNVSGLIRVGVNGKDITFYSLSDLGVKRKDE